MASIGEWLVMAAIYAAGVGLAAFLRWRMAVKDGVPLRTTKTFQEYLPEYPKDQIIPLAVCTLLFIWASYFAAIPLLIWTFYSSRPSTKANQAAWEDVAAKANAGWLAHLGPTHAQRKEAIETLFSERRESVSAALIT